MILGGTAYVAGARRRSNRPQVLAARVVLNAMDHPDDDSRDVVDSDTFGYWKKPRSKRPPIETANWTRRSFGIDRPWVEPERRVFAGPEESNPGDRQKYDSAVEGVA